MRLDCGRFIARSFFVFHQTGLSFGIFLFGQSHEELSELHSHQIGQWFHTALFRSGLAVGAWMRFARLRCIVHYWVIVGVLGVECLCSVSSVFSL
jgi:hypothetical protein